jgi:hypothetical protein
MPPEVEIKITANGESHYRGANDPDALCLYYTLADRHAQRARRQSRTLGDPILVMFWSVMLAAFCFSVWDSGARLRLPPRTLKENCCEQFAIDIRGWMLPQLDNGFFLFLGGSG